MAFGVVAMHSRSDGLAPRTVLDVVDQPTAATWGEEVLAHFARRGLLEGDLLPVLAAATGVPLGELTEQVLPVVRKWVEQGFLG